VRRVDRLGVGGKILGGSYLTLAGGGSFETSGPIAAHVCRTCGNVDLYLPNPEVLDSVR